MEGFFYYYLGISSSLNKHFLTLMGSALIYIIFAPLLVTEIKITKKLILLTTLLLPFACLKDDGETFWINMMVLLGESSKVTYGKSNDVSAKSIIEKSNYSYP